MKALAGFPGKPRIWAVGERVHGRLSDAGLKPAGLYAVPNAVGAITPLVGRILLRAIRREDKRLKAGWTCEPPTFYERNYEDAGSAAKATMLHSVPGLITDGVASPV